MDLFYQNIAIFYFYIQINYSVLVSGVKLMLEHVLWTAKFHFAGDFKIICHHNFA